VEQYLAGLPERQDKPLGLEMICFDMEHYFARRLPGQAAGLKMALRHFSADVILVDSLFFGTLILLVTTGGQPIESIPAQIPSNARVAKSLPYELVMQNIDLLITNGGYSTVNMALAHGVPIASAGLTEDKEEVSAHVQWAGIGIDLRTNQPDPEAVRAAAKKVLDKPVYRERSRELLREFR
jgi:UDP-N-acetylglucosamine:LPS N-acetylglucosamine transferase